MQITHTNWRAINRYEKAGDCPVCNVKLINEKCPACNEEWNKEKVWQKFHSEEEISVEDFFGITTEEKNAVERALGLTPEKKKLINRKLELLKGVGLYIFDISDIPVAMLLADYQRPEEKLREEMAYLEKLIFGGEKVFPRPSSLN